MDTVRSYQLNKGTVLDGRYEIESVLGEGGFGITYAGSNIRTGRKVAVKEFFCREYMDREADGITAVVADGDLRDRFEDETARFMREARLLGEFKDEPCIVSVLDYFEANGTAYIVMEYIEGITLRDHVKENGPYGPEMFFEDIRPLLKALARVHDAGIIHRDISPDNIMRTPDGNLVLIDFGSAKDLSGKTATAAVMYKDGFAPIEQYSGKKPGPETDIYALCAVFYYCLTAVTPEASIQRSILDELSPVKELAPGIPDGIDRMISKGMAMSRSGRFSSVSDMEEIIEKHYPLISPDEKARRARRRKRRKVLAAAAAVIAVLGVALYINANRLQVLFHLVDTESVVLERGDMSAGEFKANTAIAKKRVAAFSGGKYIWDQDEDSVTFEMQSDLFGDLDPAEYIRYMVARPLKLYFEVYDEDLGYYLALEEISQSSDIAKADADGGETVVTFSEAGCEKFGKFLSEKDLKVRLAFDIENDKYVYYDAVCSGDGKTLLISSREAVYQVSDEFAEMILTEDPMSGYLKYVIGWNVRWEDPGQALMPGRYQVNENELMNDRAGGEKICLKYRRADYYAEDAEELEGYDADLLAAQVILKNRLDAMAVPYAVGTDKYNSQSIVVETALEDMRPEAATMLGLAANKAYFEIGTVNTTMSIPMWLGEPVIEEDGSGGIQIPLDSWGGSDRDESRKEAMEYLEGLKADGNEFVYFHYRQLPIARAEIDKALSDVKDNDMIVFDEWCAAEGSEEDMIRFARMALVSAEQSPEHSFDLYSDQFRDAKGNVVSSDSVDILPASYFRQKAGEYIKEWKKFHDGAFTFITDIGNDSGIGERRVVVRYTCSSAQDLEDDKELKEFCEFYRQNREQIEDGTFNEIDFFVYPTDYNVTRNEEGEYVTTETVLTIITSWDDGRGRYCIRTITGGESEDLAEHVADYLRADSVIAEMITEDTSIYW